MQICLNDWIFEVNLPDTVAYSQNILSDHCQCGYCRNFYAAVDSTYPQLRPFLAQFGNHVETPEELMPFEPTVCSVSYCISGSVIQSGSRPLEIPGTTLEVGYPDEFDFNTACPQPYFVLTTGYLELPWVLDEDPNEVISPANEPEYLEKMWDRLLMQTQDDPIVS